MQLKIIEKKENKLLDRLEVKFELTHPAATPQRLEVKAKLAAMLNYDENLVIIKKIDQQTGMRKSVGKAHAYKSQEILQRTEPKHLIKRNTPPGKE